MPITHLPLASLLASTDSAQRSGRAALSDINVRIAKARKVVVVSGAGISCSSGIPDFRSENGLYALVKSRYPDAFISGKDLFSSGLFAHPSTAAIFYTFIAELSLACNAAKPTRTHHFIQRLETKGKLLRSYTQNVDGFERRLGIESGGRGSGLKKNATRNVELHGDLGRVRCVLCYTDYEARGEWVAMFRTGEPPSCPACEDRCMDRIARAARATPIGSLRPSIVLYDEPHPLGDQIGELQVYDMRRGPDVLLVMGTSLKVHGLKRLVKDFARVVHDRKGIVVFVNATAPPSREWDGVIDFHVEGQTDQWVEGVEAEWRKVRPQDWEVQTILDGQVVHKSVAKSGSGSKAKSRAKPKAKAATNQTDYEIVEDIVHLPTPPPSQSPKSDCSSPLSSAPPTPCDDGPDELRTPRATPPTPDSPSKRAGGSSIQTNQSKKSKTSTRPPPPRTNTLAAEGRGNLFAGGSSSRTYGRVQSDSALVFGGAASKVRSASSSVRTKATAAGAAGGGLKAGGTSKTIRRPPPPEVVIESRRIRVPSAKAKAMATMASGAPTGLGLSLGLVPTTVAKSEIVKEGSPSVAMGDKENAPPHQPQLLSLRGGMRRTTSMAV